MSTYFDIGCRDCRVLFGLRGTSDTNWRDKALLHVVEKRHVFEECCDVAEYDLELRVDYIYIPVDLFGTHKGHRLGVYCEYESFDEAEVRFEKNLTWEQFREESRA